MSRDPDNPDRLPAVPATGLAALRGRTEARIALGRAGAGLPTAAHQRFLLDHARAQEAVWSGLDWEALVAALSREGHPVLRAASRAGSREAYVRRPDLGRQLDEASRARLVSSPGGVDVALVVADGLSASAVGLNAAPLAGLLLRRFRAGGFSLAPIVAASEARVALGDAVGAAFGARVTIVLIGERPGLSASDSLGAYLTYGARPGTPDSRRNCVSNIRERGLPLERAAAAVAALAEAMLHHRTSGIGLLDRAAAAVTAGDGGDR